jgi:ribosomal protein S18 acetylase RimI-like enzyme
MGRNRIRLRRHFDQGTKERDMRRDHLADIVIRPAVETDAATVAAIHVASWRDAYAQILTSEYLSGPIEVDRTAVWSKRLRERPPGQLVDIAFDPAGSAQGFVCGYLDHDPVWGSLIDNLHALPQMRGRGIGERLMRGAARQLLANGPGRGLHLWVFEANEAAVRFYKRHGGEVVEREVSKMPAAGAKAVLRVHWKTLAQMV